MSSVYITTGTHCDLRHGVCVYSSTQPHNHTTTISSAGYVRPAFLLTTVPDRATPLDSKLLRATRNLRCLTINLQCTLNTLVCASQSSCCVCCERRRRRSERKDVKRPCDIDYTGGRATILEKVISEPESGGMQEGTMLPRSHAKSRGELPLLASPSKISSINFCHNLTSKRLTHNLTINDVFIQFCRYILCSSLPETILHHNGAHGTLELWLLC